MRTEFNTKAVDAAQKVIEKSHKSNRLASLMWCTEGDVIGSAVRSRGFQWKWALRFFALGKCELFNCTATLMLEELCKSGRLLMGDQKIVGVSLLRGVCMEPENKPLWIEWSDGAEAPENRNGTLHKAIELNTTDGKQMILDFASMQYGKGFNLGYVFQQRQECTWFETTEVLPASELLLSDINSRRDKSCFWEMLQDAEAYFGGFKPDFKRRIKEACIRPE
jgi:hypothetical protein